MATAGTPVTGQTAPQSAECNDPSIQPCPPCCGFMLNPQKLAIVAELPEVATRQPSSFAEPVNGGSSSDDVSTGTMVLAVAAVAIAGGTAWWLWSGRKRRR